MSQALDKAVESGLSENTEVEIFTGSPYLLPKKLKQAYSKKEERPTLFFNLTGEPKMGMTNGRTICSKHDEIRRLASAIQSYCADEMKPSDISATFSLIQDKAEQIDRLAADAKEDGQSMESGLSDKRDRISELEKEKEELEEQIQSLEEQLEEKKKEFLTS